MKMNAKLQVNLSALAHNVQEIKRAFPDVTYYIAVLKSNAYGHGFGIVPTLVKNGINYIAVSTLEEAKEVRSYDKQIPILCMVPIALEDLAFAEENNITLTIASGNDLKDLQKETFQHIKIHFKLDTGMHRLGFQDKNEFQSAFLAAKEDERITVEGIFTHFATVGIYDPYYDAQTKRFQEFLEEIDTTDVPIIHAQNSSTLATHNLLPQANAVRLGTILYGFDVTQKQNNNGIKNKLRKLKYQYYQKKYNLSPIEFNKKIELQRAMTLQTRIVQIKKVHKGNLLGYGTDTKAKKDMFIAILPIGYNNGIGRLQENRYVIINHKHYPVLSIMMNMMIIEIDTHVQSSDSVIILGEDISIGTLATFAKVTNSEMLLNLGKSNTITYIENEEQNG